MRSYTKYKGSKIGWLGEIPEHWNVKKAKYLFDITKRISGELGHNILSITQKGIKIKDTESGGGQLSMDYSKYQIVDKGDFGMNHMDLLTGYVDISKYDGVMSPDYRVFKLKHKESDARYMLYLFQKGYWDKLFFPLGQGSSELGRWRLPADEFKLFKFPVPSKTEQIAIADFLDNQTTQIKKFIELKEKTIVLLKERKTAIINYAVTKGLDPNVEMKDSGIEWLGEIPKHWEVKKLKYLAKVCNGQDQKKVINQNGKYNIYGSGGAFGKTNHFLFKGPSVLLGRKGTIDKPQFVQEPFWSVDTAFYTKVKRIINIKYFYYLTCIIRYKEYIYGSAIPSMTQSILNNISFALPPIKEQLKILQLIDSKTQEIDKSITETKKEIELIKEYQQSLISEAVTGKIDVREKV